MSKPTKLQHAFTDISMAIADHPLEDALYYHFDALYEELIGYDCPTCAGRGCADCQNEDAGEER